MKAPPKSLFVAFIRDGTMAGVERSRKGLRRWLGSCLWSDEDRANVKIERYVAASRLKELRDSWRSAAACSRELARSESGTAVGRELRIRANCCADIVTELNRLIAEEE